MRRVLPIPQGPAPRIIGRRARAPLARRSARCARPRRRSSARVPSRRRAAPTPGRSPLASPRWDRRPPRGPVTPTVRRAGRPSNVDALTADEHLPVDTSVLRVGAVAALGRRRCPPIRGRSRPGAAHRSRRAARRAGRRAARRTLRAHRSSARTATSHVHSAHSPSARTSSARWRGNGTSWSRTTTGPGIRASPRTPSTTRPVWFGVERQADEPAEAVAARVVEQPPLAPPRRPRRLGAAHSSDGCRALTG